MPVCYAFANQKGGVGKTTTVVNVACVMALWGQKVLVVDVDPQCNATTSLGLNARTLAQSSYELLLGGVDVEGTRVATRWNGLDLVPSSPDLAGIPLELGSESPRERASHLAKALESVAEYDYILIDSPPSLGLLTVNALVAAHGVIIPVQCEYLALEGLTQLMRTISLVRRGLNPRLVLRGLRPACPWGGGVHDVYTRVAGGGWLDGRSRAGVCVRDAYSIPKCIIAIRWS